MPRTLRAMGITFQPPSDRLVAHVVQADVAHHLRIQLAGHSVPPSMDTRRVCRDAARKVPKNVRTDQRARPAWTFTTTTPRPKVNDSKTRSQPSARSHRRTQVCSASRAASSSSTRSRSPDMAQRAAESIPAELPRRTVDEHEIKWGTGLEDGGIGFEL